MATILVVDDNAINRKLLVALLSGDGYLTVEASDGLDGLTMAHAHRPQLIISDILMPSMDGYGFVRALREDAVLRGTPVIFYTAHYHEREAHKLAQACGVTRVLVKPCPNADILKVVEQTMAGVSESAPAPVPEDFDREHLRLLTNKLSERAEALAVSNSRFSAMADLNLDIASERDRSTLLERVCSGARRLLGSNYAVLAVAEDLAEKGVLSVTSGIDSGRIPLAQPELHAGALGRVLTQRLAWRTCGAHSHQDSGFPLGYPRASSFLAVPIMTPSRIYGWLCLADKVGAECFDADDEKLLLTLGALAGRNYENIRLQSELQRQSQKLQRAYVLLGGLNALLAQAHNVDEVCQEACRLAVEHGQFRLAYVEMAAARGGEASFIAAVGEHTDIERFAWRRPKERLERDDLIEIALSTDAPVICNDLRNTQLRVRMREELLAHGYRSMAVLPLRGTSAGRLVLLSDEAGVFDEPELRLLNEFSGGVAMGLLRASVPVTASFGT